MNYLPRQPLPLKLLTAKETAALLTLSRQQLWQMKTDGLFPESIQLNGRRIAWRHGDVLEWMQAKVDTRLYSSPIRLLPQDRFMTVKDVGHVTTLSAQQIVRMEERRDFPSRIQISAGRIVWLEREILSWIDGHR
jgi:predicted DNA-binding transcriptional regulator AlpA